MTSTTDRNLEIHGNLMRVPPTKELKKSIETRRLSEEPHKTPIRRSISGANRSPTMNQPAKRSGPAIAPKTELKPAPNKNDENESLKSKISTLEEEIRRLKRRIDELEKELADAQKQIRVKDKKINELTKENEEFQKRQSNYQKQLDDLKGENHRLVEENSNLQNEIKRLEALNKSARDSKNELDALREKFEREIEEMREQHSREIKIRDDKIAFLKKQIGDSLKDNSWERQQQIEELTKQLKRTHDEYELLRQKLNQYQNKRRTSNCGNCSEMLNKIEEKNKTIQEKDSLIQQLLSLTTKFKNQISNQDELMKLLSTYNNSSLRH